MESKTVILKLSAQYEGDWEKIYNDIKTGTLVDEKIKVASKDEIRGVTILDEDYPESLKHINRPPFVIYTEGDKKLLKNIDKKLAIIGSRDIMLSEQTPRVLENIISKLEKDTVIVSGLARGVDTLAHELALKYGLKTIAVLPSGIDNIYPYKNRDLAAKIVEAGGLLVSEYPASTDPEPKHFVARNRIIVGFSEKVLTPEVKSRSGTMTTVSIALSEGKDIYVVPVPAGTPELQNNRLIKEGAELAELTEDLYY